MNTALLHITLLLSMIGLGVSCETGPEAYSQVTWGEETIQLDGTASRYNGVGLQNYQQVWTDDISVVLTIWEVKSYHKFTFNLHNVTNITTGTPVYGTKSIDGSFAWSGFYDGQAGEFSLDGESSVVIDKLTDSRISGTFTVVLENGATFTSGTFTDIPISEGS